MTLRLCLRENFDDQADHEYSQEGTSQTGRIWGFTPGSPLLFFRASFADWFRAHRHLDTNSQDGYFELIYETTIPTLEEAPEAAAWISESQFVQERSRHLAQPTADRAEASDAGLADWRMAADSAKNRFSFERSARIKQGRDFARVRQKGERLVTGCLIANWQRLPSGGTTRLGVITSGKIGNAVVRNRARRLMRESFRLHQHDLTEPLELVLVARPSIAGKAFGQVEKDFLTTLRKAGLLK